MPPCPGVPFLGFPTLPTPATVAAPGTAATATTNSQRCPVLECGGFHGGQRTYANCPVWHGQKASPVNGRRHQYKLEVEKCREAPGVGQAAEDCNDALLLPLGQAGDTGICFDSWQELLQSPQLLQATGANRTTWLSA